LIPVKRTILLSFIAVFAAACGPDEKPTDGPEKQSAKVVAQPDRVLTYFTIPG